MHIPLSIIFNTANAEPVAARGGFFDPDDRFATFGLTSTTANSKDPQRLPVTPPSPLKDRLGNARLRPRKLGMVATGVS